MRRIKRNWLEESESWFILLPMSNFKLLLIYQSNKTNQRKSHSISHTYTNTYKGTRHRSFIGRAHLPFPCALSGYLNERRLAKSCVRLDLKITLKLEKFPLLPSENSDSEKLKIYAFENNLQKEKHEFCIRICILE